MGSKSYFYVPLAKRADFNLSVKHIQAVLDVLGGSNENIADAINERLTAKEIESEQVLPIVSVALLDKWGYKVASTNLESVCKNPEGLIEEISKWNGVDIVLGYQHPDLGFLVMNPKNPATKAVIESFRKNELLDIYVGTQGNGELDEKVADGVIKAVLALLDNRKATVPPAAKTGKLTFKAKTVKQPKPAAPKKVSSGRAAPTRKAPTRTASPAASYSSYSEQQYEVPEHLRRDTAVASAPVGSKNMSPLVSVLVTNELFHNGNVEAWKRIIRSYNAKYPNAEVMVFYDGERIVDINTLFKWGKVKHGTMIQFRVAADEINDLSKLRKYLGQGASPMFEAFLKGSPDTVLTLF